MSVRIFIDTNLFVYAHVSDDALKHEMAVELLKTRMPGAQVIISTQVLSEFYSVMSKYKRPHSEISRFLTGIIRCANVAGISLPTVELCLKLKDKYGYSYWDSLILASAVENNCGTLYSEDMRHDQTIEERLTIQNPFTMR
jgi:predicted nucleic acid-binding protein